MTGTLRDRLRALPKVELHLHALGAVRPSTLVELARASDADGARVVETGVERGFAFAGLAEFVAFFIGLFDLFRSPEEFERITYEILEDASRSGVRHAEVRWTPTSHMARAVSENEMFAGLEAGRRAALADHGIHARWIVDFPRGLEDAVAEQALAVAVRRRAQGVRGFDVAGDESHTVTRPAFARLFAEARAAGLGLTAHAGEGAGPESVAQAVDGLGARRIGHGTRSVEDPALLGRLASLGVCLEVCPSSNEALGVVGVADHPIGAFLDAGIPCTVSTDDPTLFATDLVREYERLHRERGLPLRALGRIAATGFEHAFVEAGDADAELQAALVRGRAEADAWCLEEPPTL